VTYDVQLALRDLSAAAEQVSVAQSAMSLAAQTLTQAQDRFRAGVASNIEVVQAQQAEVAARESHIASLYTHNLAKVALARAIGLGEQDFTSFLGGQSGWLQKP
jgi:outer membrane protein TolC